MLKKIIRSGIVAIALVALVAAATTAVAQVTTDEPPTTQPPVESVAPDVANVLSVLEGAQSPSDKLPADTAAGLAKSGAQAVNVDLARAAGSIAGDSLYVAPANEGACVVLSTENGAGISCARISDLTAGQNRPATVMTGCTLDQKGVPSCDSITLYGLAADGTTAVRIVGESGEVTHASVANNTYVVTLPFSTTPTTLEYLQDDGKKSAVSLSRADG